MPAIRLPSEIQAGRSRLGYGRKGSVGSRAVEQFENAPESFHDYRVSIRILGHNGLSEISARNYTGVGRYYEFGPVVIAIRDDYLHVPGYVPHSKPFTFYFPPFPDDESHVVLSFSSRRVPDQVAGNRVDRECCRSCLILV